MAETIGALSVDLRLLSAKFEQGVGTVNKKLDGMSKQAKSVNRVFGSLLAVGGGAAFSHIIKGSLDAANRLGDLSNRLGTTVEGLSRLEYAAKVSGVQSTTLATGLQRMTRRVSEASYGTGEAVKALDELGLSAKKLNTLRPEEQFEVLADALERVPSQSDKVRLGMKLLDSEGVALLQTMKGGSAAIRAMGEESDRVGNTISTKFANSATAANAAMIKLGAASTGLTNTMVSALGPTLAEIANWLTDVLPAAIEASRRGFKLLAAGVLEVFSAVMAPLEGLYDVLEELPGSLGQTYKAAKQGIQEIRSGLTGGAGLIYEELMQSEKAAHEFKVTFEQSNITIDQFIGRTEAATETLKKQTSAAKEAAEAEKARKAVNDDFGDIKQSLFTDDEVENEKYLNRMAKIEEFSLLSQSHEMEANAIAELEHERHQKAITEIEETENKKRQALAMQERRQRVDVMTGMFSNLSTLMNSKSKRLFEIGKAAAIARALVSGTEAVVHSYKWGAELGGPILGAAFAATAAASTAVQIQQIKSQQFGGGGTVNAGTSGGGAPGVYQPSQPTIPSSAESANSAPQIIFNGPINGVTGETVEILADLLSQKIADSDIVIIEPSSRNGQLLLNQ